MEYKKHLILALSLSLLGCNGNESTSQPLNKPMDLIFMPGLQVNYDSCTPRILLEFRIARAVEISKNLKNPIFVAQGKGNPTSVVTCVNNGGLTEANAIKKVLVEKYKINSSRILLEEESTSTVENAIEAKKIVDSMLADGKTVSSYQMVTSNYHVYRRNTSTGEDSSAMMSFNSVFGPSMFTSKNSFSSSEFGYDQIYNRDFTIEQGWDKKNSVISSGDVNGDKLDDLIAFKGHQVFVALSKKTSFSEAALWSNEFLPSAGAWDQNMGRFVGDMDGDKKADALGLTDKGIIVSLSNGNGFNSPQYWNENISTEDGLSISKHKIQVIDVNNDGKDDLVVFGKDGLYVSISTGSKLNNLLKVDDRFGLNSKIDPASSKTFNDDYLLGPSSFTQRLLADIDGDNFPDVLVYGENGIYAATQDHAKINFGPLKEWLKNDDDTNGDGIGEGDKKDFFGPKYINTKFTRTATDMTGDGMADLVIIDDYALRIPQSTGKRFEYLGITHYSVLGLKPGNINGDRLPEIQDRWGQFVNASGWDETLQQRLFADVDGNGLKDMIGIGQDAVYVSLNMHP
jgi:hypothetical protein